MIRAASQTGPSFSRAFSRAFLVALIFCGQWGSTGFCCCGFRAMLGDGSLAAATRDSVAATTEQAVPKTKKFAAGRCPKCIQPRSSPKVCTSDSRDSLKDATCRCSHHPCVSLTAESYDLGKVRTQAEGYFQGADYEGHPRSIDSCNNPCSVRFDLPGPSQRWQARACIWRI